MLAGIVASAPEAPPETTARVTRKNASKTSAPLGLLAHQGGQGRAVELERERLLGGDVPDVDVGPVVLEDLAPARAAEVGAVDPALEEPVHLDRAGCGDAELDLAVLVR